MTEHVDPHRPDDPQAHETPTEHRAASTAPAVRPPRWSGAKTAVTAALAISVASGGAIAAAASLPQGSSAGGGPPGAGRDAGQQPPWMRGYASRGQPNQQWRQNQAPGQGQQDQAPRHDRQEQQDSGPGGPPGQGADPTADGDST